MRNGQMERAIQEAQEIMSKEGSQNASVQVVFLAGIGYLRDILVENRNHAVTIRFEGKKFFAFGMMLGGIIGGTASSIAKWVSI